ncbi:MAG TPA: SDR family oxidoreductase [Candidatus Dormibacteraeota bacterium]|jgi:NAD(P)-dependent dehydrogenase (short-subunit alcohol dehydrogenase family)|nr:SDR family oxidoreductase [Candidatus Dormibacteraeota bacterium]
MNPDDTVIVIGGGSGIGLAVAGRVLEEGGSVVIAGRSRERLEGARTALGPPERVGVVVADVGYRDQLARVFEAAGRVAHVVVTAADLPYGAVRSLTEAAMLRALRSKFMGPLFAVQEASRRMSGGSITLISGIAAARPAPGGILAAGVNGAIESMVKALALEVAPIRVNAVSPGWLDTPIWDGIAGPEERNRRFAAMAERLPLKRIGRTDDVAAAVAFLMASDFVTGTVLHAEGGQLLV